MSGDGGSGVCVCVCVGGGGGGGGGGGVKKGEGSKGWEGDPERGEKGGG